MKKRKLYNRYSSKQNTKRQTKRVSNNYFVFVLFVALIIIIGLIIFSLLRKNGVIKGVAVFETISNTENSTSEFLQQSTATTKSEATQIPALVSKKNYDLKVQYDIGINIDFIGSSAAILQKTKFTNTTEIAMDKIYFRLYPNIFTDPLEIPISKQDLDSAFPQGIGEGIGIQVGKITLNSKNTVGELKGKLKTTMQIIPEQPIEPGKSVEVEFEYIVKIPQGAFSFSKTPTVLNLTHVYAKLAEFENGEFQYNTIRKNGEPWTSNVANFKVVVETDKKYSVACTGKIKNKIEREDGRNIYTIEAQKARDFALGVSTKAVVVESALGDTAQTISFAKNQKEALQAQQIAKPIIDFYNQWFKTKLDSRLNLVQTSVAKNIFSQSGLIFYDEKLSKDENLLQWYLAKAISNQYFGVLVEANPDFNEQMSDFCAAEYFDFKKSNFEYKSLANFENSVASNLQEARKKIGTIKFDNTIQLYISKNAFSSGGAAKFVLESQNDEIVAKALEPFAKIKQANQ